MEKKKFRELHYSFGPEINKTEINTKYKGSLIVSEITLANTKLLLLISTVF